MWDGRVRRAVFSVRLYGFAELARMLRAAGFQAIVGLGRNGEPLTLDSRRLIVVAGKGQYGCGMLGAPFEVN